MKAADMIRHIALELEVYFAMFFGAAQLGAVCFLCGVRWIKLHILRCSIFCCTSDALYAFSMILCAVRWFKD